MAPNGGFKILGGTELEVMQILWADGPGSVRDVYNVIRTRRPVAYTTIMTVLSRLADKGLLAEEGTRFPGYVYTPLLTKEELMARAVREMVADLQPTPLERRRALAALVGQPWI